MNQLPNSSHCSYENLSHLSSVLFHIVLVSQSTHDQHYIQFIENLFHFFLLLILRVNILWSIKNILQCLINLHGQLSRGRNNHTMCFRTNICQLAKSLQDNTEIGKCFSSPWFWPAYQIVMEDTLFQTVVLDWGGGLVITCFENFVYERRQTGFNECVVAHNLLVFLRCHVYLL